MPRIHTRAAAVIVSAVVLATVLPACATRAPARAITASSNQSTVTFADQPGLIPDYIFPVTPGQYFYFANMQLFQQLIYKPLYWFGSGTKPIVNYHLSLAYPPVFSDSDSQVTITLKKYRWSDGTPVTTRDVQLFIDLLEANKASFGDYTPGYFPDNIKSIQWTSPSKFTISFTQSYNPSWILDSELSQITPLPQQTWDKVSATSAIGNYDYTTTGAVQVWNFLNGQSSMRPTYDTNPLWQVMDGPWRIEPNTGYAASTGYLALVPNAKYSGPDVAHVSKIEELPFTSDTAEYNAVQAGEIDYGYMPYTDLGQIASIKRRGYRVVPWEVAGWNFMPLNFRNAQIGAAFSQLYVRQAIQDVMNQSQWVRDILKGFGSIQAGPIPADVPNPYADTLEHTNLFPFSLSAAKKLLTSHGWKVVPSGTTQCIDPGSGSTQCGAGISKGESLKFTVQYASGLVPLAVEMQSFKSAASEAGIVVNLREAPSATVQGNYYGCTSTGGPGCSWQALAWAVSAAYVYDPDYYPSGEIFYKSNAAFNGGGYSNPEADTLIAATLRQAGLATFDRYENFISRQLPTLWLPNGPYQISIVKGTLSLGGAQGVYVNIYPQNWSWKR
jgi:peptide/nickel transport system substrate-binding protein